MNIVEIIGWVGLISLIAAWIPQTYNTIKDGNTPVHIAFILLYFFSSLMLTIYSVLTNDTVFTVLNAILTFGSGINLFYKLNPRKKAQS